MINNMRRVMTNIKVADKHKKSVIKFSLPNKARDIKRVKEKPSS